MRAGHMCGRADTDFHMISGIHLGISEHLMVILGMPSYPQCNRTPIYTGGNKGPEASVLLKVVISGQAHPCSLLFGSVQIYISHGDSMTYKPIHSIQ